MTALYVALVLIVAAAVPVTVWLKREGDRSWRRHLAAQRCTALSLRIAAMQAEFARFAESVRDALTPAVVRMTADLSRFSAELNKSAALTALLTQQLAPNDDTPREDHLS